MNTKQYVTVRSARWVVSVSVFLQVTEHMRYAHPLHPKARVKKDMSKAQAVARAIKRLYRVCYAVTDTSDLTCLAAFTKRDGQHVW